MLSFRGVHFVERFKLMWLDNLDLRYWERQQFNWHKKFGQILSQPKCPTENPLISEDGFGWFGFGHYNALRLIMRNNSELYLYQTISGKFPTYMIHHDPKISGIQSYTWILIFPFTQQKKNIKPWYFFRGFQWFDERYVSNAPTCTTTGLLFSVVLQGKFSVCRNIDLIICNSLIFTRDFVWRTHEWTKWPLQRCAITVVSDHLVFVGYHGVLSETMEDRCFFRRSSSQWMSYIHGRPLWMAKGLFPGPLATLILGWWIPCLPHFVPWQFVHHVVLWNFRVSRYYNFEVQPLLNKFAKHLKKSSNSDWRNFISDREKT